MRFESNYSRIESLSGVPVLLEQVAFESNYSRIERQSAYVTCTVV